MMSSCLPASPLDFLNNSSGQCESGLLSSPGSFLSLLSCNRGLGDPPRVAPILPGVPDMFLVPEYNSQEACLLHGHSAAPHCGPDGVDVHLSLTLTDVSPPYSHEEGGLSRLPLASLQPYAGKLNSEQPLKRVVSEEAVREQVSRQAELHSRALRLQKRLRAQLGKEALLHCSQQLEGLKRLGQTGGGYFERADSIPPALPPPPANPKPRSSWREPSTRSPSALELREFSQSCQAVLRHLKEALDSEATASSSSDEEQEEARIHRVAKTSAAFNFSSCSSSCERKWLEERAKLGSRWSWLQLRLADLEGKIQQLVEINKHIRLTKSCVVLAECQPPTDRQIQQTLLREMAGLSCTASDADNEPCSPMRLLHNIERQSAQLSKIVNSLMPPFNFRSPSKPAHIWKGARAFTSGARGQRVFMPWSSKRRSGPDVSCVCARTRPLVTCQRPKLFILNSGKHLQSTPKTVMAREEWSQMPAVINPPESSPAHYKRRSCTSMQRGHKYKQHGRQRRRRTMGLSPTKTTSTDVVGALCQLGDPEESSAEERRIPVSFKRPFQSCVYKRKRAREYIISNVVIPMSPAKVEKLQYKDIVTPSWRQVPTQPLLKETVEEQEEVLSDEVFAQRHLALEWKEKFHWSSAGKRKRSRGATRSGRRLSGSRGGMSTSGGESSLEWSCALLDADEQPCSDEGMPRAPWEPRVFPLDEEEEALLSDYLMVHCPLLDKVIAAT